MAIGFALRYGGLVTMVIGAACRYGNLGFARKYGGLVPIAIGTARPPVIKFKTNYFLAKPGWCGGLVPIAIGTRPSGNREAGSIREP